jgi:hypothetical protein
MLLEAPTICKVLLHNVPPGLIKKHKEISLSFCGSNPLGGGHKWVADISVMSD